MNLKESFRYQNFLDTMMRSASASIQHPYHCYETTKTHLRSRVNPEAEDTIEKIEQDNFFANDNVISFMIWLVEEREKLSTAIGVAKSQAGFDIDASIETNKFRQTINSSIRNMLRHTTTKSTEQGKDYKFNLEGNQMPYLYDVEVVNKEAYNRTTAKIVMRDMISTADETSAKIDAALINIQVKYTPVFDVNETFDDVMTEFIEKIAKEFK